MSIEPSLLLISEYTLSVSRGGHLANSTLYNLFEQYPPDRLLSLAPRESWEAHPPVAPFDGRSLAFKQRRLPRTGRRLLGRVNPLCDAVDARLLALLPLEHERAVEAFRPDVAVLAPLSEVGLMVGRRWVRRLGCPYLVYFLDDWVAASRHRRIGSAVQRQTRDLLKHAAGWLMISEELRDVLSRRYALAPRRCLTVHNPVELPPGALPPPPDRSDGTFRVAYAGSVHTMHLDGLLAVAEAIHALRRAGRKIELVLHTAPEFWRIYQEHWRRWEVVNGGLVPYHDLTARLREADLLLVALAFRPDLLHMSRCSVLTKITDYMASGVPMVVCGPPGCASINFVKRWNCGLSIESNDPAHVAAFLDAQMGRRRANVAFALRSYDVLREHFTKDRVSGRLYQFIREVFRDPAQGDAGGPPRRAPMSC
jgi:glycosyltransferase involved in cell wall biosynthesis